jgi:hypothetical protein
VTARYRLIAHGTDQELAPLEPEVRTVRVNVALDPEGWQRLGANFHERPELELTVREGEDLEFLEHFPGLRVLRVNSLELRSIDGLRHVADSLDDLGLGDTLKPRSIRAVGALTNLRRFSLAGGWRDLDAISSLTRLERLGVGSIDLELLRPLQELRRFTTGISTIGSLPILPEIGRLELIEMYRMRGPHDLSPLGRISTLRYLLLESTRAITELPSFADCLDLRWVALDEMRGITDLRPIAAAPNLEVLLLVGMNQLDAESLRPFLGHPALRAGIWGFGSVRRNRAAVDLLPLPPSDGTGVPWDRPDWDGIGHPTHT